MNIVILLELTTLGLAVFCFRELKVVKSGRWLAIGIAAISTLTTFELTFRVYNSH